MSEQGRYRIQAVARLTGVPAATLRQWERRYGVPSPDRTASAYRIYGQRHVDQIRRMVQLTEQGISPSEAARLVAAEPDVAAEPVAEPLPPGAVEHAVDHTVLGDLDPYVEARARILRAVEEYDYDRLTYTARKLMYLGSAVTIFEQIIAPVMREIGQRWHDGQMSVAQEHMASEVVGQLLHQMLPVVQPQDSPALAVLGCYGEDTHSLPLYGLAFRLAQWSYRSIVLGARTPPAAIRSSVANLQPTVIGLSVTLPLAEAEGQRLAEAYGQAAGDVPWLVGGRGVRSIAPAVRAAGGIIAPTDGAGLRRLMVRLAAEAGAVRTGR